MTYNEVLDIISLSTNQILKSNQETISKKLAAVSTYPSASDEFKKSLTDLFLSSVQLSVTASIKTLIELGYLHISE